MKFKLKMANNIVAPDEYEKMKDLGFNIVDGWKVLNYDEGIEINLNSLEDLRTLISKVGAIVFYDFESILIYNDYIE